MRFADTDPLNRRVFPVNEWALVETEFPREGLGHRETLFAVGNGYLGLRGNVAEGRDGYMHGTFVNGFHETWPIRHAEDAFGFARVGQTIVNAPDAKIVRLYVDDEPLVMSEAELTAYERRLDFRTGQLTRRLIWRTPSGKHVRLTSRRMVSFTDRHLAVIDYEVELLDADAAIAISSQILNRQDGRDEYLGGATDAEGTFDPRKAETFTDRVLQPRVQDRSGSRYVLGYRCTDSQMTIAVAATHLISTDNDYTETGTIGEDQAKHLYRVAARRGVPVRVTKLISYHTASGTPAEELADRCVRTLDRAIDTGADELYSQQRNWLTEFWARCDVEIGNQPELQQATRWNLYQLAQATARTDGGGVAAKGVSGSGYGGHYFWDTEIYVMPFLSYTTPSTARNLLRFRQRMLKQARARALELNQRGALYPWRTINGLEAGAYYAAGTAQYHINADIAYALSQYTAATGDTDFLVHGAIDIFVETARMWEDLGFWRTNGKDVFHIHGVTGPDEYTTVVNDNLYTNVMARANLAAAADAVDNLRTIDKDAYDLLAERTGVTEAEIAAWRAAATHMHIPFDSELAVHPQDAAFLDKELWDLENTPSSRMPLLLHYHPLVIYRFQVLKQADVVLALYLQGDTFTAEEKLANFEYYDPLTTGDSTLSSVVQSIIAAEVGYHELALRYFRSALHVDLADLHHNTADGVHVASTGGVWAGLVSGFGGFRDHNGRYTFDPRLPDSWNSLRFRLTLHGSCITVDLTTDSIRFEIQTGPPDAELQLQVRGESIILTPAAPRSIPLEGQGPRLRGAPTTRDLTGERRADGSLITATIPAHTTAN